MIQWTLASVGLYAIQLASICGLDVITTCSPRNADLVRSCGAKHVFDYNDSSVIEKIQKVAPNIQYIFDTIGNSQSSSFASQVFKDHGGNLCTVRPGKANTEHVTANLNTRVTDVLVWTAFLKDHRYAHFHWPVRCHPKKNLSQCCIPNKLNLKIASRPRRKTMTP